MLHVEGKERKGKDTMSTGVIVHPRWPLGLNLVLCHMSGLFFVNAEIRPVLVSETR